MSLKAFLFSFLLFVGGFNVKIDPPKLRPGFWRGVLEIQSQELPFNFEITGPGAGAKMVLFNAEERLEIDSLVFKGDSVIIPMHIFDTQIRAKIDGERLTGVYLKNYVKDYKLPFRADFGKSYRFPNKPAKVDLPWKYKLNFSDKPDSVYSVAVLQQKNEKLTGSILTISGDHRFLEGVVSEDSIFLSTFDGENAYLYKGKVNADKSIAGTYWSGRSYNSTFKAVPNQQVELPSASSITYLKPGYDKFSFSFPGLDGTTVSLEKEKYKGKVVVVQLLGTWCPNCMDETKFLAPWYKKNKKRGIEVIGIAFEKKDDFDYAKNRLANMKKRLSIDYDLAFGGSSDKEATSKAFPMLNKVGAFPTTIFIDKKGRVRKIHTGFSGPGTGEYYVKFVEEYNTIVNTMLKEQ